MCSGPSWFCYQWAVVLARPLVLVAAVVSIAAAVPAAGTSSPASTKGTKQECGHGIPAYTTGPEVVFGRTTTQAAAETLRTRVVGAGFKNASLEVECSDVKVVVRGYDTYDTAVALQAEASTRTSFRPTVECYQAPDKLGEIEVSMGNARDLPSTKDLVALAASRGFVGAKLEADACGGYEVTITGFTDLAQAQAFVSEAYVVGFDARLEPNS